MSGVESKEVIMDRKSGRVPSVPLKSNGADYKKDSNPAKSGKGGYKREGNGNRQRNDNSSKRPYSQKPRNFIQRRQRPRESYGSRHGEGVSEDYRADATSALKIGNKKTNLNHLLNFSVGANREEFDYSAPSSTSRYKKRYAKRSTTQVKYNKEQFLQANCQFVVKEDDYSVHAVDPDILVEWDHIEQIRIYSNEVPSCPICLYPPVAAKITRCGHIYCWRCMLHYLSLGEKTWRKCPICYEAIHQKDLKSVCALETHHYRTGEQITMRLMKRERDSTFVVPAGSESPSQGIQPRSVNDDTADLSFAKLLIASADDVQRTILDIERVALETQLAEEGAESLEGSYVKAALELLKERQIALQLARAAKESINERLETLARRDSPKRASQAYNSFAPLSRKAMKEYASAFSDEEVEKGRGSEELRTSASQPDFTMSERSVSESSEEFVTLPQSKSAIELAPSDTLLPATEPTTVCVTTSDDTGEWREEISVDQAAEELAMPTGNGDEEGEKAEVTGNQPETGSENGNDAGTDEATPGGACGGVGARATDKRSNALYYYQASDGQHIYLHSVNARCLVREYGSLENCPQTLTANIVELEGISMNQDLRGRLRYLNHLPLTCEFKVVELALRPPLVSKETLNHFAEDLERRKRARQRKTRDERRQLRHMQHKQNLKYQNCPEMRALLDCSQFPVYSSTIVQSDMPSVVHATTSPFDLSESVGANSDGHSQSDYRVTPSSTPVGSPPSVVSDSVASSVGVNSAGEECSSGQALSFAQMLRAGKKSTEVSWPRLGGASGGGAQSSGASGWAVLGEKAPRIHGQGSDSENEDRVPVPLYRDSFGEAVRKALDKHDQNPQGSVDATAESTTQQVDGGKKKKKKTKTLLFTTSMARTK